MLTYPRYARIWLCALAMVSALQTAGLAQSVSVSAGPRAGGQFLYNFTIRNKKGSNPIAGLIILKGNSAFGLDQFSAIKAPQNVGGNPSANWSFFTPVPPTVDMLDYFSLNPAGNVPVGSSLGGFTFKSSQNPNTLTSSQLGVILVDNQNNQLFSTARLVPESGTLILFGVGILCFLGFSRLRRMRAA